MREKEKKNKYLKQLNIENPPKNNVNDNNNIYLNQVQNPIFSNIQNNSNINQINIPLNMDINNMNNNMNNMNINDNNMQNNMNMMSNMEMNFNNMNNMNNINNINMQMMPNMQNNMQNNFQNNMPSNMMQNWINTNNNQNLYEKINNLTNENFSLKNTIKIKDIEIKELKQQIDNLVNNKPKLVDFNQIRVVQFISDDHSLVCGINCLLSDTFAEVEEKLYKIYPEYRETNNIFQIDGRNILRFKTIAENNIQPGHCVLISKMD